MNNRRAAPGSDEKSRVSKRKFAYMILSSSRQHDSALRQTLIVWIYVCLCARACVCVLRKVGLGGGLPKGITALRSSSQERALLLRQSYAMAGHRGQLCSVRGHSGRWRRQYRLRDAIEAGTIEAVLRNKCNRY